MFKREESTKIIRNAKGQVKLERTVEKKGLPFQRKASVHPKLDAAVKAYHQKQKTAKRKVRSARVKKAKTTMRQVHRGASQVASGLQSYGYTPPKRKKKKGKKKSKSQYVIQCGVAYRIAGTGKKRKKKSKGGGHNPLDPLAAYR